MNRLLVIGPSATIAAWLLISATKVANPLFLPSFSDTVHALYAMLQTGSMYRDLWATLYRTALGFAIAAFLGIPLGLIFGYYAKLYSAFEIVIDFFRSLPGTSLYPLFLLLFGVGSGAQIATAVFVAVGVIFINSAYGVLHNSKVLQNVAMTLDARRLQIFYSIVTMEALPQIFAGLRTALSIALIVVVANEMFMGSNVGLGQKMFDYYLTYQTARLYAVLIMTGLLGYALNKLFRLFEARVLHWIDA